jgi:hypothetical protein
MPNQMLQTGSVGDASQPIGPELLPQVPSSNAVWPLLIREGWPFVISCGLIYFSLAIQILGFACTDQNFHSIFRPAPAAWSFIGEMGLDLSTLAPLLGLFVVYIVRTPVAYETLPARRRFVWTVAMVSLVLAFLSCWLSWNGHPTWLRGFVG